MPACTTSTASPRFWSPRAASSPSSPPPITTALVRLAASAIIVEVSSSVRKPKTPSARVLSSAHSPVIGGKNDRLPVARISLSYRMRGAVVGVHHVGEGVDAHDADSGSQVDVVVGVPVQRIEVDLARIIASGKDIRQQDAVVVAVRLVAEHGDVEVLAAAPGQHLLDRADPGHTVAHDDEPCLGGGYRMAVAGAASVTVITPPPDRGRRSRCPSSRPGQRRYSSSTVSASRSSTTRSATWVAPLAAMGK